MISIKLRKSVCGSQRGGGNKQELFYLIKISDDDTVRRGTRRVYHEYSEIKIAVNVSRYF